MNVRSAVACLGLLVASSLIAQELPAPKSGLTIERLFEYPIINGRSPSGETVSPDGRFVVYGTNKTGERRLDVYVMDVKSGKVRLVVESAKIQRPPRQDDERTEEEKKEEELYDGGMGGFRWSPDSKEIMAGPYRGRVWLFAPDGSGLRPLIDSNEGVGGAQYSPDGKYVGFMRGQNVFRLNRQTGEIKQLTFLSKSSTGIDGFEWSPDGKRLFVTWSSSAKMGRHVMMDFSKEKAEVVNIRRMWHGEMSWDMQIGIVDVEGGLVKFVEGLPRYMWVTSTAWAPDSSRVAVYWIKDDFQEATVTVVNASSAKKEDVYVEKAPKNYIPDFRNLSWTRDSQRILFTTDIREGKFVNRGLYSMLSSGQDVRPVYAENHDIAGFVRPKESDRIFLVTQARSPLTTEITVLEPKGEKKVYAPIDGGCSTRVQFDDCAPPLVSDDGKTLLTMASSLNQAWELYRVEPKIERLTFSPLEDFKKIEWADFEQVTFEGPGGVTVFGTLVVPKGLDKSVRHPAVIHDMYANSAKHAWHGYFANYAAQELGVVGLYVDFAASWGQGGERNSSYYKSMGVIDTQEALAAKKFLASLGYVDEQKVGVWGWSYGGFLTCMIQLTAPGEFATGVAVASVTDWKSYNEWYTRRRLGMEKDDLEVYKKTSPVWHAKGLNGDLLLIHGMLDDNVLYQDTARMAQALIDERKQFSMFGYPRDDHNIGLATSRPHVFGQIMRHLYRKLK